MSAAAVVLVAILYFGTVTLVGILARRAGSSPEEYFLAERGLRTAVLFMALFGTNTTSFVLVGIPALAYERGIGVFGLNAAAVALGVPLSFWAIGSPARRIARRVGALTPAELYARHLGSRRVGGLLFGLFTIYTIPYMVQGVKAASLVVSQTTDGAVAAWVVGLAVTSFALLYTVLGGMRATAWTNVVQGTLFLLFLVVAFFLIARSLGGFAEATASIRAQGDHLLGLDGTWLYEPRKWISWSLVISATVIAFPHMLVRLMAAKDDASVRAVCRLYPLALILLWLPAVMIGAWGRGAHPGLENPDRIFQLMAATHLPAWLGAVAFLAVLAAVMSTLDAQILTLSSMLLRDLVEPLRGRLTGLGEVRAGRIFTLGIALVVYVLSIVWGDSIFEISRKAFEGYTTLVPTLLLGVRWRRFTASGAIASLIAGNAVLALGWLWEGFPTLGFLPAFWAFVVALGAGIVVSLLDHSPSRRT